MFSPPVATVEPSGENFTTLIALEGNFCDQIAVGASPADLVVFDSARPP